MSGPGMNGSTNETERDAMEKDRDLNLGPKVPETHPSGAKAPAGSMELMYGLKPVPFKSEDSSAANETGKAVDKESRNASTPMTLAAVREELKSAKGKRYWRSVDELADTAEFQAAGEKEFPGAVQEWVDPVSRRG